MRRVPLDDEEERTETSPRPAAPDEPEEIPLDFGAEEEPEEGGDGPSRADVDLDAIAGVERHTQAELNTQVNETPAHQHPVWGGVATLVIVGFIALAMICGLSSAPFAMKLAAVLIPVALGLGMLTLSLAGYANRSRPQPQEEEEA